MDIVPLNKELLPEVCALEQACFTDAWSEAMFLSELTNPLSLWLVAMQAQTVVGYAGAQAVPEEADVLNLCVKPTFRRQGIAQQLLAELNRLLYAKGVRVLALEVRASNEPAKALYAKLGFTLAGVRRGYYLTPREDAWILKKRLEEA